MIEGYLNNITGLGLTAKGKRKISPGREFNKYFPSPNNTDPILHKNGSVDDTVDFCIDIVKKTLSDTRAISKILKGDSLEETCRNIFDFYYKHFQYHLDKTGVEQLRRPARAWQDRGNSYSGGIDCDCFSISVSSVLTNLNIPHSFRIVKMYGRDYYQHIYVVVPKVAGANMNNKNNYLVIDPVLDQFNLEAPGVTQKNDKAMTMPIQYLNGVNNDMPRLGREFDGLGEGLGNTGGEGLYRDFLRRQKMNLINTMNHIKKHPHTVSKIYKPEVLAGMYGTLIGAWDNDNTREATLEHLSGIEENALQNEFQGLGSIIHSNDDGLLAYVNGTTAGLGTIGKAGVFTKLKNAVKKVGAATKVVAKKAAVVVKKAAVKTAAAVKTVAKKAVTVAKKVGAAVLKYNPISLAARLGFLVAMKTNFGKLAERMYWGYFTEAEAKAKGKVTSEYWKKAVQLREKTEKIFVGTLKGEAPKLKEAAISGRGMKKATGVKGLGVEPITTAASMTAAMAFITPVLVLAKTLFKGKGNGKELTETGGEEAASVDPALPTAAQAEQAAQAAAAAEDGSPDSPEASSSNKGLIIGGAVAGLALIAGVAYAMSNKKKSHAVSGTGKKTSHKKKVATVKLT